MNSTHKDGDNLNKEDIFVQYLYKFFPIYQDIKDKSWTRIDDLNKSLPEFDGGKTIRQLLTNPNSVSSKHKNVIVFRGEKEGDGKKFYINKLIEACYEAIPHFLWKDIRTLEEDNHLFRFPVLVLDEVIKDLSNSFDSESINIITLASKCIKSRFNLNEKEQHIAL